VPTPVVIYAAKSTQDKHRSIETQIEDDVAKAEEEGWEIIWKEWRDGKPIAFTDEKFSAYSGNRGEDLRKAKEVAAQIAEERGEVCMLLAQASDRFARGAGDKPGAADALIEIWHQLRRQNVHLRSVEDDGDLRDSPSVANLGHRAMMESKRKSGSVKKGMRRRARKGLPTGGPRPLALRYGEQGYEHVRAEVPIVNRIFKALRAGKSQSAIARELAADRVPTVDGGRWHQGTISNIARNPIYKGFILHEGELIKAQHDPVVAPSLWGEVNDLLAQKVRSSGGRGRPPAGKHLFRKGMLTCVCGESLVPRTDKERVGGVPYEKYICYGRKLNPSSCSMAPLSRAQIDVAVYSYYEQVGLDVETTREQLAEAQGHKLAELRALHASAAAEQSRVEVRLARVRRDYMDEEISAAEWKDVREELSADLNASKAGASRLEEQLAQVEEWNELKDIEQETLEHLTEIRRAIAGEIRDAAGADEARAALLRLFDGFRLRRIQPGVRVHAELAWQGEYYIEPIISEMAVAGFTSLRPILRREGLHTAPGTNTQSGSRSGTRSCAPASALCCAATPTPRTGRAGSASSWSTRSAAA
jgi:DNA invertase Pin-like site-specific DNA recombinase